MPLQARSPRLITSPRHKNTSPPTPSVWQWCVSAIILVLSAEEASAFGLQRNRMHWKRDTNRPIEFVVNVANVPPAFTQDQYLAYLRKALEPWEHIATADLPFTIGTVINDADRTSPEEDGVNMIFWKPGFAVRDQFAGKAYPFSSECDILLAPRAPFTLLDIQAIVMHELGHCLGLTHSTAHGVMTKFQGLPVLSTDDAAGVSLLYPRADEPLDQATASVIGRVLRGGKSLLGAVLRVVDARTQRIMVAGFSGLVDGQRRVSRDGHFELPGIPPGRYTFQVEPMDTFAAADPLGYGSPVEAPPEPFQSVSVDLPVLEAGKHYDVGTIDVVER